jgi:hypothetical protein
MKNIDTGVFSETTDEFILSQKKSVFFLTTHLSQIVTNFTSFSRANFLNKFYNYGFSTELLHLFHFSKLYSSNT